MERRNFIRNSGLAALATAFLGPETLTASPKSKSKKDKHKAKNIIFLVSDGMSHGTLNMANLLHQSLYNKSTNWIQQYEMGVAKRALMDTASASSLITDSAAASSSWGGGKRVINGAINTNADGTMNTPILQKFKNAGKKVGVVTTVPVTHATPAGFCVATPKRNNQELIASMYLDLGFDVYLGGGKKYFDKNSEHDDLLPAFKAKGYHVATDRNTLLQATSDKKILGLFADDALPYSVDQIANKDNTPSLAEMTKTALAYLENEQGFVLQVEAGKVDWAAHANDIGGLLYDQLAMDEALGVALDFAKDRNDTLVIFTTDHGNASPGVFYGHDANDRFAKIKQFKASNDKILNSINKHDSPEKVQQIIAEHLGIKIKLDESETLLGYYNNLSETGVYNYKHLPYKYFGQLIGKYTATQFADMDHSGEYVEVGAVGPYSDKLPMFIKNFEMHQYLLDAAL